MRDGRAHNGGMFAWARRLLSVLRRELDRGAQGESIAASWLERHKRLRIRARNWRSPRDRRLEIDLVATVDDVLVFIEVKTRPLEALVPGYFSAVSPRKKKALLRASRDYVARLRVRPRTVRFDVVEVCTTAADGPVEVRHFENVPLFPKEFVRAG